MTDTATVETLTAEVRVLMVGNRQVTLSVARQLDEVPISELEAFGRIRLGKDLDRYVIGRNVSDGSLVVSEYYIGQPSPLVCLDDLDGQVTVCRRDFTNGSSAYNQQDYKLKYGGRSIVVEAKAVKPCEIPEHQGYTSRDRCDYWHTNGTEDQITAVIAKADAWFAPHQAAAKLPLIVLAGLR